MLTLVPILLLFVSAILVLLLGKFKLSIGSTWLLSAGTSLLVWLSMILIRFLMPSGISISNWTPLQIGFESIVFAFTPATWTLGFLLVSLLVGVIFTDTTRLGQGNNLTIWVGSMILTGFGLFAILSQTFLAVILTWTVIDIVEIIILTRIIDQTKIQNAAVVEFMIRITGTFLIITALVISQNTDSTFIDLNFSPSQISLIISGAFLRLGVLPIHIPLTANLPVQRSLGTILRFTAPMGVISFLIQIDPPKDSPIFFITIFSLAVITALYGAIKWYSARNGLFGRPYWMLVFSGLIFIAFLRGQNDAVLALSMVMITSGGVLFLYSTYSKIRYYLLGVLLVGMIGFPYTPVNPIWTGIFSSPYKGINIFLLLSLSLTLAGLVKHLLNKNKPDLNVEKWMSLVYNAGLILLVLSSWLTMIWRFPGVKSVEFLFAPILSVVVIAFITMSQRIPQIHNSINIPILQRFISIGKKIGAITGKILQFEWLFDSIHWLYLQFSSLLAFFLRILEGDGGLLWGLLFLVLLSSVIVGVNIPNG